MIIVLIHWRIKPSKGHVSRFQEWWKLEATINNKANLVGESLSAPMPASNFKFAVDDLSRDGEEAEYRHFINVGLWKDWRSFEAEVGHNFNDNNQPMDFEAARRTRTILEPQEWRIGTSDLPSEGTCI